MATDTRRVCRTPEEAFQAGWDHAAQRGDRPTPAMSARLLGMLAPQLERLAAHEAA